MKDTLTKAQRIYADTKHECESVIKIFGADKKSILNNLVYRDSERLTVRTYNAIEKLLLADLKWLERDIKFGILTKGRIEFRRATLEMLQGTLRSKVMEA